MKPWILASQILAGLPLLVYPFLLLANVMSLAGERTPGDGKAWLASRLFLWSSTAYPLVFMACFALAWAAQGRGDGKRALALSVLPLAYLLLVALLFINWQRKSG